ncbi:TlpA family protein disulfide reductase [Spirosoma foliorum]|uniref:TlpA family protein disulfide reductase n=1 Tax=Spirosoma foliorum TaxID=2710596 RepID=A0A7G5H1A2_9BACT|nr:TlpA disulfide reductase family protein [Spirosoma foliorum]QMW04894.1 TlpA family protein disulfide reductase [Spirosoma foliorum]
MAQPPLSIPVKGSQSGMVYLSHGTGQALKTDSALIANHQFTVSHYQPFTLYTIWFRDVGKDSQKAILYPAAHIQFDAQYDLTISLATDSVNYWYLQFRHKHLAFIKTIGQLSYETSQPATQDSLYRERARVYAAYTNSFAKELVSHRTNLAAVTALYDLIVADRLQPPLIIKNLYTQLAEPVIDSYYGAKTSMYLNLEQQVSQGSIAPVFQLPKSNGQVINLKHLRGKYILLDFWASWCGPCRVKNKKLATITTKLSGKLQLISVSLDTSKQKWLAASQKDGINWLNLCDLQGFKSQVAQAYNITGVPRTFLISPQGKILGADLSFAEIAKRIN